MRFPKLTLASLICTCVMFTSASTSAMIIRGKVVQESDGAPVVGAQITTSPPGHVVCTDSNGGYTLRLDGVTNEE